MSNNNAKKELIKNVAWVFVTNGIGLVLSLVMGFVFPKYVSAETYASYKTYMLYISYVGLFHFGFINGIYLKYGAMSYEEIPKGLFRFYSWFLIKVELLIEVVFIAITLAVLGLDFVRSPFFYLAINFSLVNISCYFSLVNQFTIRFRIDSIIQIIVNMLNVAAFIVVLIFKVDSPQLFLNVITFVNLFYLISLMLVNREITFGKIAKPLHPKQEIISLVKSGFVVMVSEFSGLFILTIDSVFINLLFNYQNFAVYSFAISIVSIVYSIMSIFSKLFFPYMMRIGKERLGNIYVHLLEIIMEGSAVLLSLLIIAEYIVKKYIPGYKESVVISYVLGITVMFRALMEFVNGNYYKVLKKTKQYWNNNMIALGLGIVTDAIAYIVFGNMLAIAIASAVSFFLWYYITLIYFMKELSLKNIIPYVMPLIIILLYSLIMFISIDYRFLYFVIALLLAIMLMVQLKTIGKKND